MVHYVNCQRRRAGLVLKDARLQFQNQFTWISVHSRLEAAFVNFGVIVAVHLTIKK